MLIYDVAFTADTDQLKTQLAQLKDEVRIAVGIDDKGVNQSFNKVKTEGRAAAEFLQNALQKATSVDGTSLSRFNAELKKSGVSAQELARYLSNAGLHKNLNTLTTTIASADTKLTVFNDHIKEMHRVLSQSVKFRAAMQVQDFLIGQAQSAINWTKDLNANLVQIQVVSEKTSLEMEKVFDVVIEKSRELNTTAKEYSAAAQIYYQQGLGDEEVARRTEITIKAARAAGEDALVMSKNLTAIWNTYQATGDELQRFASIAARLGADTAVDFAYIAEAMQTSATAAAQLGLSYENLAAVIATVGDTTQQNASVVGNAFKTIFSRFDQLQASGTDGEVTLGRISQQLADMGIHILDAGDELKSLDTIIYETGNSWTLYSQKQQIAIAEILGGTRQYGQVLALFNNWDKFLNNAGTAFAETGDDTLEAQFLVASQSIEVYANRAAETWQRAFGKIANDKNIKNFYTVLQQIGESVEVLIESFGGLPQIIGLIGVAFGKNIISMFNSGINQSKEFIENVKTASKEMVSLRVAGQINTGEAIAKTQTGAERQNTERQFSREYLTYYDQLNEKIRTGTAFEKEAAQSEKSRFTALNTYLDEVNIAIEKYRNQAIDAFKATPKDAAGYEDARNMAGIFARVTPEVNEVDIQVIKTKLEQVFTGVEFDLKTDTPLEQLNELSNIVSSITDEGVSKLATELNSVTKELEDSLSTASSLEDEIARITEEIEKQIAIQSRAQNSSAKTDSGKAKAQTKANVAAEEIKRLQGELAAANKELDATEKVIKKLSSSEAELTEEVNKTGQSVEALTNAAKKANLAQPFVNGVKEVNKFKSSLADVQKELNKIKPPKIDFSQALRGVASVSTSIISLASLFSTLSDSEASFSQKLTSSILTLSFSIPMLVGGFKNLVSAMQPAILLTQALVTLNNAEASSTALATAAKMAGITITEGMTAAQVKEAIAKKLGLVATVNATTGEVAYTLAKNASAVASVTLAVATWLAVPPLAALAIVIALVVAALVAVVFAVKAFIGWLNKNRDSAYANAEAMQKLSDSMNEAAESAKQASDDIESLTQTLKEQRIAGEDTSDTLSELASRLDDLKDSYRDLGVSAATILMIEQAEAVALLTDNWDDYYAAVARADAEAIQNLGAMAEDQTLAQLAAAMYAFAEGKGTKAGNRHVGAVGLDREVADILLNYSDVFTPDWGYDDDGTIHVDFTSPEGFIQSYERLQELTMEMARAGKTTHDVYREINDELEATAEYYQAIKEAMPAIEDAKFAGVVDDLRAIYGDDLFTESSIDNVEEFRRQVDLLAYSLSQTLGISFEEARRQASTFLSGQGGELQSYAARIGISDSLLTQIATRTANVDDSAVTEARTGRATANFAVADAQEQLAIAEQMNKDIDRIMELQAIGRKNLDENQYNEYVNLAVGLGYDKDAVEQYLETGAYYTSESEARTIATRAEADALGILTSATEDQTAAAEIYNNAQEKYNADLAAEIATQKANFEQEVNDWFDGLSNEDVVIAANIVIGTEENFDYTDIQGSLDKALENAKLDLKLRVPVSLDGSLSDEEQSNLDVSSAAFNHYTASIKEAAEAADQFNDIVDANGKVISSASDNIDRIGEMALTSAKSLNDLRDAFEDYADDIKKADKGTIGYAKAMGAIREAISGVLNIGVDALSNSFLENSENLKLMEQAVKGSTEALDELRIAASSDILQQIIVTIDDSGTIDEINALHNILANAELPDLAIGATIDNAEFLAAAQEIMDAAEMTADQARAYFGSMGYDVEVTEEERKVESKVPIYETRTTVTGEGETENGLKYQDTQTRSFITGYDTVDEVKIISALKTHPDGENAGAPIITKKATSSAIQANTSGVAGAKKPSKGGGGGSGPKTQDALLKKNSENRLDYLNDLLGLYGKIEFYGQKEVERLEKEAALQKEISEAAALRVPETKAERDAAMEALRSYGVEFSVDETGLSYIKNLEEVVAKYGDTNEDLAELVKTYTDAEKGFIDARSDLIDSQNAQLDKMLQAALSINKQTLSFQERALKVADSWQSSYIRGARILTDAAGNLHGEMSNLADDMYAGAARLINMYFDLDLERIKTYYTAVGEYADMWDKIQANNVFAADTEYWYTSDGNLADRAAVLQEMHNVQDGLISTLADMYAFNEKVWSNFSRILSEWNDKLDVIYNKFDSMKSVAQSMLDIAKITGTAMFTPEQRKTLLTLQKTQLTINKEQVAAAKLRMDEAQAAVDQYKAELQATIDARDRTHGKISDDEYARQIIAFNKLGQELEDTLTSATNEYWSAFKGSVEDAWDYYQAYGEEIIYKMQYNLATGAGFEGSAAYGSYSFLGTMLDMRNEELDRYLNPGTQVRNSTQLQRDLESIDTSLITNMEEYESLMADILAAKNMEVDLTEYDYQILQERFNLIKAQAAFEDARAAKNTMRLARDASGNWSYVYSSDPDATKDSAKDVEDSLNKIYELSWDRIRSLVSELYNLPYELEKALASLDPNDPNYEQQALEIEKYYTNYQKYLLEELDKAQVNSALVSELVTKMKITDLEYLQSIQNLGKITVEDLYGTELGWLYTSEEGNKHLRDVIEETVNDQIENWKELQYNIEDVFDAAGEDVNTFADDWAKKSQQIGEDAQIVGKQFQEMQIAASNAISTMIENAGEWARTFAVDAANIVASINSITDAILRAEAAALNREVNPETGVSYRKTDYAREIGQLIEGVNIDQFGGEDSAAALAYIMSNATLRAKLQQLISERDSKIAAEGIDTPATQQLLTLIANGKIGWDNSLNSWVYWHTETGKRIAIAYEDLEKMMTTNWKPVGFATGGFVPSLNSMPSGSTLEDSVPAMLTPAEYVLNPADTQAFFKAFGTFLTIPNLLTNLERLSGDETLQQMVQIYADFPNVSSRDEIQAALNNIINQAKQYNV